MKRNPFAPLLLVCLLGFLLTLGRAHAGALPLSFPPSITPTATGYAAAANGPSISGGAFPAGMAGQVGGKPVTMPLTARLAANAPRVAAAALRMNPAGLAAGLAAAWLGAHGLEWLNDQWQKRVLDGCESNCTYYTYMAPNGALVHGISKQDACDKTIAYTAEQYGATAVSASQSYLSGNQCVLVRPNGSVWTTRDLYGTHQGSPYPATYQPATEADWEEVSTSPLSDGAANELRDKGVALPLDIEMAPGVQTISMSDPYYDPATGKTYRDIASITPNPTNPRTAELQVAKQEVDAQGNPATDPQTGEEVAPEESDDPCKEHPDRLSCMEKGDIPDGPDIDENEKQISITPVSGFGAATAACPADLTTDYLGHQVSFSFKPVCDGVDMLRPVVLGMAWLSAILVAMGISRRAD